VAEHGARADVYISADIEADGPIPGDYSMLSFGLAVAGRFDGRRLTPSDLGADTFYREIKPISERFSPAAVEVTGLDRSYLIHNGSEPVEAMTAAKDWVIRIARDSRPVMVGFPLVFDWLFLYWYFEHFAGGSPFSYSSGLDMKTMYAAKARVPIFAAGRDDLPASLRADRPHTHNALDDALEQAEIFVRLFDWPGRGAERGPAQVGHASEE
jgi:hypothetical protein